MVKTGLLIFSTLLAFSLSAQNLRSFEISVKGDTINALDKTGLKQGKWVLHTEPLRGEPGYEEEGEFIDDKRVGPWRRYNLSGDILAIENYKWGFRDGKQQYFSMLGDLLREEGWIAMDPKNPYDTIEVPDLNNPMVMTTKIIKHETSELKHGIWKIYDPTNGAILKSESWFYGEKDNGLLGGGGGDNKPVSGEKSSTPKPKAVADWEKKNAGKKNIKVRDGRTG